MADADNKNTSQDADPATGKQTGNESKQAFAEMQEQLKAMNSRMEETLAAIAAANKPPAPKPEELNLYDPANMEKHVMDRAEKLFDSRLREEKTKDITIFNLAQEYPEIQTDTKVRQAVLDAQKTIPQHLQGTAEGYELAVLKATTKAGLIPKSQRKVVDDEPTYDGTRRDRRPQGKQKLSEATKMAAALMGRDIEDPEVIKRLEQAAQRDTFTKYR